MRLGFGLNVMPMIMKAIVSTVLEQEEGTMKATSSYINDIYSNEEVISADEVKAKLESFGLTCKDPECLKYKVKVLGLKVWEQRETLRWKRGTAIPETPAEMTQCTVFSMCEKLVDHFPVCGWLRGVLKRHVTAVTKRWDELVDDASLRWVVEEVLAKVTHDDPIRGNWSVFGEELNA